ncbi:hypothetical protein RAS2_29240 [Phycisphaerae bacterium RAS2]|nr:hypothetical protein RAS2_29240 [Phycisphaerae bacterium RAS2]
MRKRNRKQPMTMTQLLRDSLLESDESLNAIALATGLPKPSIVRFRNRKQSLRLDLADRLAAYLGIECCRTKRPK